jgi:hypothetical protein
MLKPSENIKTRMVERVTFPKSTCPLPRKKYPERIPAINGIIKPKAEKLSTIRHQHTGLNL